MSTPPFIVGPINAGQQFIMTTIIGSDFYVLNAANISGGSGTLFFDSQVFDSSSSSGLAPFPVFTATGNTGGMTITSGGSNISVGSNNLAQVGKSPTTLVAVQTQFAPWNSPVLFLTENNAVDYSFTAVGNTVNFNYGAMTSKGPTINGTINSGINIQPISFYVAETCHVPIKAENSIICTSFCISAPTDPNCQSGNVCGSSLSGFTREFDCPFPQYTLCPVGSTCGSNCVGPCPNEEAVCTLTSTTVPNKATCISKKEVWEDIGIIIGVSIGAVLLLVVFAIIFYIWAKRHEAAALASKQNTV